jgi:hypothetical protein
MKKPPYFWPVFLLLLATIHKLDYLHYAIAVVLVLILTQDVGE